MGLGGCYACIKYLMFAFNFLFWLLGCAILGVGIWVRVDPDFQKYVDNEDSFNILYTGAYILIGVGLIIMVIGFLGCCGAIRESQWMLASFFICLFIIFAVLLGAGIYAIVAKNTLDDLVTTTLNDAVKTYRDNPSSETLMNNVQTDFGCCGATRGVDDYLSSKPIPASCKQINYNKPCKDKLLQYFADHMLIIAGVAIGIAIVMILGMIFSMILCCAIRDVEV